MHNSAIRDILEIVAEMSKIWKSRGMGRPRSQVGVPPVPPVQVPPFPRVAAEVPPGPVQAEVPAHCDLDMAWMISSEVDHVSDVESVEDNLPLTVDNYVLREN